MPRYTLNEQHSQLSVMLRSTVHDTELLWRGISGTIDANLDDLSSVRAEISVDMCTGDAGDWLKNRKLRKEMRFDEYPTANFSLQSLENLRRHQNDVSASLLGSVSWRNKNVFVHVQTHGTLTKKELVVAGTFDLDITQLGIVPPKVLMIKIHDIVNCRVSLNAFL